MFIRLTVAKHLWDGVVYSNSKAECFDAAL